MSTINTLSEIRDTDHYHLKYVRISMLIIGLWPVEDNNRYKTIYEIYFWMTFSYYIIFCITGVIIAGQTWSDNYLFTASTMGITIEYIANAYKVIIFKSDQFRLLTYQIIDKEKQILKCFDWEYLKIFKETSRFTRKVVLFYVILGGTGAVLYFFTPLINNYFEPLQINNLTGVSEHYFIVNNWFPFDPNRHYSAAYTLQFIATFYGYGYIIFCGALFITMLNFVAAHLKILQHTFINFTKYSNKFKKQYGLSEETSQFVLLRILVKDHTEIIDYVERVNECFSTFILLNYFTSSFQLALLAYQIYELPPLKSAKVISYFVTLSTQLFLVYQNIHNISIQSENIAASIFKSDWHTYSPSIIKLMQMICLRAQKPLGLTIGPMANVQVSSVLQVFKALYSYLCIMMRN